MRRKIFTLSALFLSTFIFAQSPKVEWVKTIGGIGNDRSNSVEIDPGGNIILVGRFQSPTIALDGITLTKNTADNADVADIFILKLDKGGKAIWAVTAGDKGDDHATSCVTDREGNIYVVGWFESRLLKFGAISLVNKSEKGCDMYVAKFSPDGKCLWANNAGGEGGNGDYSTISLDNQNNVVVAGIAGSLIDFGNGVKFTHEKSGMYVAKYSNDGKLLWAKAPAGKGEAQGLATDPFGHVYIGGFFNTKMAFDDIALHANGGKSTDAFVTKYSPEGKVLWARNFGGEDGEIASCETDPFGNVYLGGMFFSRTVTAENTTLKNNGSMNTFITKYDSSGKFLWTRSAGGNNGEGPATATREFFIDDKGNAFCTGSNWSEFTFAGKNIKSVAGSEDIFLLKYDKEGNEMWGVDFGGAGRNAGRGITTDKAGKIYLTGSFEEKELKMGEYTLINAGDSDIFIVKFSE